MNQTVKFNLLNNSAILIFALGCLIRLPFLFSPMEGGYREPQTATQTIGMLENGQLRFDAIAPWRGDLDARLTLELPAYNLLVLGAFSTGLLSLDTAGALVSLLLWAAAFWTLQPLWKILLPPQGIPWANLLFVLSPLGWYLSLAFMPETLVLFLTAGFLLCIIRYATTERSAWLVASIILAAFGLLIKFPAFAHLGIFAGCILLDRQGLKIFKSPILCLGVAFLVACLLIWSRFVEQVNTEFFPYWAGSENILTFIGPWQLRLQPGYYVSLAALNLTYVLPLVCLPFVILGAWQALTSFQAAFASRVWVYLGLSTAVYLIFWAKGGASQNYYNLHNLITFCGFFSLGIVAADQFLAKIFRRSFPRFLKWGLAALLAVGMVGQAVPIRNHLTKPDLPILQAADWLNDHAAAGDIVLLQPRHQASVLNYMHQPLLSHLTGLRSWIWVAELPEAEKNRALEVCRYLVVTDPPNEPGFASLMREKFKGRTPPPPDSLAKTLPGNLPVVHKGQDVRIYQLK